MTLTIALPFPLWEEMAATVIACNGTQVSTTTTEPEVVVAVAKLVLLLDLVVNTVEVMVVWVILAKVLTQEVLARHLQALEEEEVEDGGGTTYNGAAGGSSLIIIRYNNPNTDLPDTMTGGVNRGVHNGYRVIQWTGSGSIRFNS